MTKISSPPFTSATHPLYVYVYSTIVQHWLQLGVIYSCSLSKEVGADPLHAQVPWLQIHHPSSVDLLFS